jgi:diaminohydroxyphosphoribosylaminopyrimidine deaminase/5-amino-6-(5-phosphoribosylamino)uracil reductase
VFRGASFETVLRDLAGRGVMSVLVEGGGQIHAEAFSGGWVDEVVFYLAPLISGSGQAVVEARSFYGGSASLQFIECQQVGTDIRIRSLVKKEVSA